ncbi:hypothetical protein E9531_02380 [Lampropedia puyangensis]|uniref:HemY N-terminal domain-containing protein n=1 Tax=Lampropedia puyangensis TaxID=1330072 RepID=A0A4V4GSB2_9BURK|nr:heme biosynthesis HemY N-terminal domain-containing protein [Lampropedia puyangensis]THU05406.1 hypothetical protein E9531_02380 [Lampropedia puyangensis]
MRSALWVLILFASAVAAALFLNSNRATVTLFWHPYRVDLSLNLFLLLIAFIFAIGALLVYAILSVWRMPTEAKIWREYRHDVAAHQRLVHALHALSKGQWQIASDEALKLQQLTQNALTQDLESAPIGNNKEREEHERLLELSNWLEQQARRAQRQGTSAQ